MWTTENSFFSSENAHQSVATCSERKLQNAKCELVTNFLCLSILTKPCSSMPTALQMPADAPVSGIAALKEPSASIVVMLANKVGHRYEELGKCLLFLLHVIQFSFGHGTCNLHILASWCCRKFDSKDTVTSFLVSHARRIFMQIIQHAKLDLFKREKQICLSNRRGLQGKDLRKCWKWCFLWAISGRGTNEPKGREGVSFAMDSLVPGQKDATGCPLLQFSWYLRHHLFASSW